MEKVDLNKDAKKEKLKEFQRDFLMPSVEVFSINQNKKKIATYENILRFYQNSILTFALESHKHYAQDIVTDEEHRFITDIELEAIHKFMRFKPATDEQIDALFKQK